MAQTAKVARAGTISGRPTALGRADPGRAPYDKPNYTEGRWGTQLDASMRGVTRARLRAPRGSQGTRLSCQRQILLPHGAFPHEVPKRTPR